MPANMVQYGCQEDRRVVPTYSNYFGNFSTIV